MLPLTLKQAVVLAFLRTYMQEHGYAPSLQEIAAAMGVTLSTAWKHVDGIEARGWITRLEGKRRTIQFTPAGCPLCGAIVAVTESETLSNLRQALVLIEAARRSI